MRVTVMLLAAAGIATAAVPAAHAAEGPTSGEIGHQLHLVDGAVEQGWTVTALRPSADVIPYPLRGVLWEADATDEALQGNVVPVIPNFSARSRTGEAYRVLFEVPTPQGVNPGTLAAGHSVSGKLYFDVTGDAPDQVAYSAGGRDLLIWNAVQADGADPAPSAASIPVRETAQGSPAPAADEAAPPAGDVAAAAMAPPPPLWQGTARAEEPPARVGTPIADVTPAPAEPAPGWVGTPAVGEPARRGTTPPSAPAASVDAVPPLVTSAPPAR
ncbi:hypothetical protein BCA37_24170 [Mycobacterium sp. djl-10]|nr:hypothetical protein BCA37_24170 [Mycobacterium sp. djl-10]